MQMDLFCVLGRNKKERPCYTGLVGHDIRQNIVRVEFFFYGRKPLIERTKLILT